MKSQVGYYAPTFELSYTVYRSIKYGMRQSQIIHEMALCVLKCAITTISNKFWHTVSLHELFFKVSCNQVLFLMMSPILLHYRVAYCSSAMAS